MDMYLMDKVAIVTGAGRGIGRHIALGLAREGVNVIICDLLGERAVAVAAEIKELGRKSLGLECDVTNQKQVNVVITQTLVEFNKIDILVNNAGITADVPFAESTKEKNWDPTINVCLYGVLNFTHAVVRQMMEKKSGKIVNIVSDAGRVGEPLLPFYSAAKGGIIALSKALAKDLGRYCINVNCVSPGATNTEAAQERVQAIIQEAGPSVALERERRLLASYPIARGLGRRAEPEDIANAVVFLCSDRAIYITGQTLSVNGGYCMV